MFLLLYLLLYHHQILEIPSFIEIQDGVFHSQSKISKPSKESDIVITPEFLPDKKLCCTRNFKMKKILIYRSDFFPSYKNLISILTDYNSFQLISQKLLSHGYITSSRLDKNAGYVLSFHSLTLSNYSLVDHTNFSQLIPEEMKMNIYSTTNIKLCETITGRHFMFLGISFFYLFFIIFCVRLLFLMSQMKLPGNLIGNIFFTDYQGSPLIYIPVHLIKYRKQFHHLLKVVHKTKKSDNVILEYVHRENYYGVRRLHAFYITNQICLLFYFEEKFIEEHDDSSNLIGTTVLTTNEICKPQKVDINVHYKRNQYPTADVTFIIDEVPCKITLQPKDSSLFPFGGHILLLSYLDCIHLGALNEGVRLNSSMESFKTFLKFVYERLDYKGLSIFVDDGNGKRSVFEIYDNDEVKEMNLICLEKIPLKTITDIKVITHQNSKYIIIGNSFQIASHAYYLTFALNVKSFLFRSSERKFLFILSILVSYHHTMISSKGEDRILSRVYNLIEKTECFTIVECISSPTNFHFSHGSIFNEKVTQQTVDLIFSQVNYNDSLNATFPIQHPKLGDVWITISSTSYYDTTLQDTVFMYLIEDVTGFHKKMLQLNAAHESGKMAYNFLGLHKVNKELYLTNPSSFASELGYTKPIFNIKEIVYDDDLNKFDNAQELFTFRLRSSLDHPVWYSAVPTGKKNGFFVFSSREISQIQAFSQPSCVRLNNYDESGSFLFANIELEYGTFEPLVVTDLFPSQQTKSMKLTSVIELFHPDDVNIFESAIDEIRNEKLYEKYFVLRMKINNDGSYKAFITYLLVQSENSILMFMSYVDNKYKKKLMIQKTNNELDFAFQNSKMILFVFEDTQMPERTFLTQPLYRNQMIFNWTTLYVNVKKDYIENTKKALLRALHEKADYDILVPMLFETVKWYLFKGRVIKNTNHITGNAIDLSAFVNQAEAKKKEIIEKEKELIEENMILIQTKELLNSMCRYIISLFEVYLSSLTENDPEIHGMINLLIDTYKTLSDYTSMIPYA
ncbi:hypothetical protein TRFO_16698 [Tritrichomonas foetus]|uniref:Uncharacterized protein n=1 Tax=Tritrichomonas foetus TaxID=1144522 RepID=A0A1J4KQP3_9EUKA|nr:hypothetical protein TRFO_16698 [Tritrichomonas foetus]|eukprot:OHT13248.1 hypothetical protein TRFO_16698 [Tritrichomonas foetus]